MKKALIKTQALLSHRKIIGKVLAKYNLFSAFPICSSRTSQTQLSLAMATNKTGWCKLIELHLELKVLIYTSEDLSHWLIVLVWVSYYSEWDFSLPSISV